MGSFDSVIEIGEVRVLPPELTAGLSARLTAGPHVGRLVSAARVVTVLAQFTDPAAAAQQVAASLEQLVPDQQGSEQLIAETHALVSADHWSNYKSARHYLDRARESLRAKDQREAQRELDLADEVAVRFLTQATHLDDHLEMALASASLTEIAALRGKDRQAESYAREVIMADAMGLQALADGVRGGTRTQKAGRVRLAKRLPAIDDTLLAAGSYLRLLERPFSPAVVTWSPPSIGRMVAGTRATRAAAGQGMRWVANSAPGGLAKRLHRRSR